jgi:hypothetical protein
MLYYDDGVQTAPSPKRVHVGAEASAALRLRRRRPILPNQVIRRPGISRIAKNVECDRD